MTGDGPSTNELSGGKRRFMGRYEQQRSVYIAESSPLSKLKALTIGKG